jgi:predicted metal-dependent peptidase
MDSAEEKLGISRLIITEKGPYFMSMVLSLVPHPVPGLKTMGVTKGLVMIYDPEWTAKLSDEEVAGVLVHEAMHSLKNHLERMEPLMNRPLANIAADMTINPDLLAAKWVLPKGVQLPSRYGFQDGLLLEEYYDLLLQKAEEAKSKAGSKKEDKGKGTISSDSKGEGGKDPSEEAEDDGAGGGEGGEEGEGDEAGSDGSGSKGESKPGPANGHCGGIAGNPIDPELEDQVDRQHGRSPEEINATVQQTLHEIEQYIATHGRGSVPGCLVEELKVLRKKSEVPWQRMLSHWIRKSFGRVSSGAIDFSLARLSKRSYSRGMPRPSLVQYTPEVAFIIDTSGSMGAPQILAGIRESIAVFTSLGLDYAWLLQVDADLHETKRIRLRDLMGAIQIKGRGGTNFDPGLQAAELLKPKPEILLYLTDGDGYVTHKPKGMEVIWVITRSHWNRAPTDWGHVVYVKTNDTIEDVDTD